MNIKPYPAMKDSGVEWLEDMPKHWKVRRLKDWVGVNQIVLSEGTDPNYEFDYLDIGSVGIGQLIAQPEKITFKSSPSRARRVVRPDDTIISTVRPYLKAVWHANNTSASLVASTSLLFLLRNR